MRYASEGQVTVAEEGSNDNAITVGAKEMEAEQPGSEVGESDFEMVNRRRKSAGKQGEKKVSGEKSKKASPELSKEEIVARVAGGGVGEIKKTGETWRPRYLTKDNKMTKMYTFLVKEPREVAMKNLEEVCSKMKVR